MLALDANMAPRSCSTSFIVFAMFYIKHIVQVDGQVLYKYATHETVDVPII